MEGDSELPLPTNPSAGIILVAGGMRWPLNSVPDQKTQLGLALTAEEPAPSTGQGGGSYLGPLQAYELYEPGVDVRVVRSGRRVRPR